MPVRIVSLLYQKTELYTPSEISLKMPDTKSELITLSLKKLSSETKMFSIWEEAMESDMLSLTEQIITTITQKPYDILIDRKSVV